MRLHRADLGRRAVDRLLDLLRDPVGVRELEVAGQLEVDGGLDPVLRVDERQVVELAHVRHAHRGRAYALAELGCRGGLDVDDDVASREDAVERRLDAVRGGVALDDGGAG